MARRDEILFMLLAAGIATAVVVRAATAPSRPPLRRATAEERVRFAAAIASHEDEWRSKAAVDFPADAWSQRDAFHGHEQHGVLDIARGSGVPVEDVFRAIDEDLHRPQPRGSDRCADAVPVKPRPIYD